MTSAVVIPNTQTSTKAADPIANSTNTIDPNRTTPDCTTATTPTAELAIEASPAIAVANANKSTWDAMLENPFQSLLAGLVVALLAFSFTSFNINIGRLDNRIDRLEDSIAADFAAVNEELMTLDDKLDAINLSLTALIAHLGATSQVNIATGNSSLNALAASTSNIEQPTPDG